MKTKKSIFEKFQEMGAVELDRAQSALINGGDCASWCDKPENILKPRCEKYWPV